MRRSPFVPGLLLCGIGCGFAADPVGGVTAPTVVDPGPEMISRHSQAVSKPAPAHASPGRTEPRLEKIRDWPEPERKRIVTYEAPGRYRFRRGTIREKALVENGGSTFSEAAVAGGLKWLVLHQAPDGHWSFREFSDHGRCNCSGAGSIDDDVAATAMALLPFLGAGQADRELPGAGTAYVKRVDLAARYLLAKQRKSGAFGSDMYAHALATIAICELFGLTQDATFREPAQKALRYIVGAQSAEGGWRYQSGGVGYDTSIGVWVLQALKAGEWAGLEVPERTYAKCTRWLDHAGSDAARFGYAADTLDVRTPLATPRMSAAGILCCQLLGSHGEAPAPPFAKDDVLFSYDSSMRMFQGTIVRGPKGVYTSRAGWAEWSLTMRDELVASQDRGMDTEHAHQKFSWYRSTDPVVVQYGGRLMQTALSLLMLETYYRYPPMVRIAEALDEQ